jgi:hypothetical protein
MIGLQEIMINNNINVYQFSEELGVTHSTVYRWFNENKVPKKYYSIISEKLNINKDYINKVVNDISTHTSRKKDFNFYRIDGDIVYIELKNKKGIVLETLIDLEDLNRIKALGICWNAAWAKDIQDYYAKSCEYLGTKNGKPKYKIRYLHREIMNNPKNMTVDHKEHYIHSSLDNRKINLRIAGRNKNSSNRSGENKNSSTGVRNVHLITKYGGKQVYKVQIMKKGISYRWEFKLDQFEEACEFAERKRKELFGEFAGNGENKKDDNYVF